MLDNIIGRITMTGMPRVAPPVVLSEAQSVELQRICRASSSSAAQVLRARIILLAAKGWPNEEIVHELNTNKMTVSKWRRRFVRSCERRLENRVIPPI